MVLTKALAEGGTSFDAQYVERQRGIRVLLALAERLRAARQAVPALWPRHPPHPVHEPRLALLRVLSAPPVGRRPLGSPARGAAQVELPRQRRVRLTQPRHGQRHRRDEQHGGSARVHCNGQPTGRRPCRSAEALDARRDAAASSAPVIAVSALRTVAGPCWRAAWSSASISSSSLTESRATLLRTHRGNAWCKAVNASITRSWRLRRCARSCEMTASTWSGDNNVVVPVEITTRAWRPGTQYARGTSPSSTRNCRVWCDRHARAGREPPGAADVSGAC